MLAACGPAEWSADWTGARWRRSPSAMERWRLARWPSASAAERPLTFAGKATRSLPRRRGRRRAMADPALRVGSSLRLLRASRHHLFRSRRRRALRLEAADGADVRRQLPDLVDRDVPAVRRHPVRPALGDRREDVRGRAAVDPFGVHQRRADAAAAVEVASGAVVLLEELLPLADRVRVSFVRIVDARWRRAASVRAAVRPRAAASDAPNRPPSGMSGRAFAMAGERERRMASNASGRFILSALRTDRESVRCRAAAFSISRSS